MDISQSSKILLVSSGQPSLNPRLVKEADTLTAAGYRVTVLYAYWNAWGTDSDKQLLAGKEWKAIRVGGDPEEQPVIYLISRLVYKLAYSLLKLTGWMSFAEKATGRSSRYLSSEAKKHKCDLYIAHNIAALPAVIKAAKNNSAKCGFDAEDMHRYEVSNDETSLHYKITQYIEDRYLTQVDQLTASSEMIAAAYRKLFLGKEVLALRNVFPRMKTKFINRASPLKLFWFSQTIGPSRGIEAMAGALRQFNNEEVELHLLGHAPATYGTAFVEKELSGLKNVFIHEPVSPDDIPVFCEQFDIGLSAETGYPYNREICLTNKIFTYIQCGLAVLASNTQAQSALLKQYPACGMLYKKNDPASLARCIHHYIQHPQQLQAARQYNYRLGQQSLNWESESQAFLTLVQQTLS